MSTPALNLTGVLEPPPSPAAPPSRPVAARAPLSVDPRLDSFVNDVIGEASKRTGYTYRLGDGPRTPEQQAEKVAGGYSRTYNSKHLSGHARDVLAFDSSGHYITDGSHAAYSALGDVYREKVAASGLPVRWGGSFHDFRDPGHFEIEDGGEATPTAAPALNLDGVLEEPLKLDGVLEPAEDDVVSINAHMPDAPAPPAPRTLSPLPERQSFDAQTEEGRQGRDARDLKEWGSNAKLTLDVPIPSGARDWSQVSSEEASRQAARTFAASRGIPAAFVEQWLDKNSHLNLHLYDSKTGEKKEPSDYIYENSPAYDFERRTLRVSADMPHLKQLEQDYQASRGVAGGLADLATDDTYSPGEKAIALERGVWDSPQGRDTRAAADYMRRGLKAADVGGWAYALGQGGGGAAAQAALASQDIPTAFDNPAGDMWRAGVEAAAPYAGPVAGAVAGNATIGKVVGAAVEPQMRDAARTGQAVLGMVAQPLNIVPLGEVASLAGAGKLGRAVEEGGELSARVAKLLHPLGLEAPEHAAEQSLDVILRGADGTHYLLNTGTNEVVDLSTGELVELPRSPHDALSSAGYKVERVSAPNRTAAGEAPDVWKVTDGDGHVQIMRDDAELSDFADSVNSRRAPSRGAQPSEWSVRTRAIIEGRNPDEALAEARASGALPPLPDAPARRTTVGDVVRAASDVINLPKSLKSAGALHGPLRQSAPIAWAHPEFIASAYGNAARAYASGSAYREIAEELAARSWFKPMNDAGLYMPSVADVTLGDAVPFGAREERFASRLADRLPGVRRVVRPGERAYLTAQDSMRSQAVEHFLRNNFAGPDGDLSAVDFSKIDPRTLRAAARDINILSGRGVVPILDRFEAGRKIVAALNNPLWSPRAMSARINLLSPYRFVMNASNPATRPVAYQQAATAMRALSTLGVTAGLVSLIPGVKFQLNPYEPAFGKLSVGDTHYDLLDGIPSSAVFAAKMARAFYLSTEGKTPKKGQDAYSLASDFFRRRESPTGKVVHDALAGRDVNGESFTLGGAAREMFLPFVIDGMYEGWKDSGVGGAAKALPGFLGVPSSSYKEKEGKGVHAAPSSSPTATPAPAATPEPQLNLDGIVEPAAPTAPDEISRAVENADPDAAPTFRAFPEGMGESNVPRAAMPQIKGEHRGAMVQFLKGRGIAHTQEDVPAGSLRPSQAEYSPEKVKRALSYDGPERSILVSSDGYVADGHHQWLSALHKDPSRRIPVIRLDAPINQLLIEMARFPSSGVDDASA
jgi:hypothetical protein